MRKNRRDAGGISILLAIGLTAILMIIGLSVDAGGVMRTTHRADDIAAEAARVGGQVIDVSAILAGHPHVLDTSNDNLAIRTAVNQYLATAGATGTVQVAADHQHLTVTVTLVYNTVILSLFGGDSSFTVTGTATAALVTT
jgi:Flp pilus assembly protein TadG